MGAKILKPIVPDALRRTGNGGHPPLTERFVLGRPLRRLTMDVLLYLLGVPLMLAALFVPWESPIKILSFVAGTAALGTGVYVGLGRGQR